MSRAASATRHGLRVIQAAAALAVVAVACSGLDDDASEPPSSEPSSSTTSSESTTSAPDVEEAAPDTTGESTDSPSSTDVAVDAAPISFASQVQPILEANCAGCHTAEGPGAAHLALETASDATGFDAEYIAAVIDVGYMPPWPAADGDVAFHGDRRLSDSDRATMATWAEQGGVLDVDPGTPIEPTAQTRTILDRDLVLTAEPYKGSGALDVDDYRCQIYDPELGEQQFLTGYGFEADQTEVVHHALLFHVDAEARAAAEEQDAFDPGIGWSCTALAGFGEPGQSNLIMSWAPGQDPNVLPDGVGVETAPGDFFVVQIHYHYEPEFEDLPPDVSRLVLDFADDDQLAAAGGALAPIDLTLYLAPAEIPCSTDETVPLCDRDAAQLDLLERAGPFAAFVGDGLLAQCGASVEDFAEMTDGIATATCEHRARPGEIISIWAHEHEYGASFKMTLNPGTPEERVLLDIPRWNFDWQLNYEPIESIVLDSDDVIHVECTWDRDKIPDDAEPRYVMWSEGTNDEMCYSQIVTRPV